MENFQELVEVRFVGFEYGIGIAISHFAELRKYLILSANDLDAGRIQEFDGLNDFFVLILICVFLYVNEEELLSRCRDWLLHDLFGEALLEFLHDVGKRFVGGDGLIVVE